MPQQISSARSAYSVTRNQHTNQKSATDKSANGKSAKGAKSSSQVKDEAKFSNAADNSKEAIETSEAELGKALSTYQSESSDLRKDDASERVSADGKIKAASAKGGINAYKAIDGKTHKDGETNFTGNYAYDLSKYSSYYGDRYKNHEYYGGTNTTIDLGGQFNVEDLKLSVDSNDTYTIEISKDGKNFEELTTVDKNVGDVQGSYKLENFSSRAGDKDYEKSVDFEAKEGRYLRIKSSDGDLYNGIGEVEVFGEAASASKVRDLRKETIGKAVEQLDKLGSTLDKQTSGLGDRIASARDADSSGKFKNQLDRVDAEVQDAAGDVGKKLGAAKESLNDLLENSDKYDDKAFTKEI